MRLWNDKKIISAAAISVAVILFLVWISFFLQGGRIKDSSEKYQKEKLNYLVQKEKKDKLLQLKEELADLENQKESLDAMFVKKDESIPIIKRLEKIAADSSCTLVIEPADLAKLKFEKTQKVQKTQDELDEEDKAAKSKNQSQEQQKAEVKKDELADVRNFPAFSVSVTGSFLSVVDFLTEMENLPFFIRPLIVDVTLAEKSGAKTAGAGTLVAGNQNPPASQKGEENKNIKMTLTVVIYAQ